MLSPAHAGHEPLLVIQIQGRRHRYPAEAGRDRVPLAPGAWEATFTVPSWAEPRRAGQAAVWLGDSVIPVPPAGEAAPAPVAAPDPAPREVGESPEAIVDTGRTGPLAELLFKENVTALHAELEQRSAEAGRLRGALADAQAQLTARATTQAALEVAQAELRSELTQLMAAATAQREDFDRRLHEAESQRDRLAGELQAERARASDAGAELAAERGRASELAAGLVAERDRLTQESAALRARLEEAASHRQGHADDLGALREQLAATQVARDASAGEVEGLRAELTRLGTELAVAREQLVAQGGDLGEAQRLLADAKAMTEQLRGQNTH